MNKIVVLLLLSCLFLVSCGGNRTVKPGQKPAPPVASKPAPAPSPAPTTPAPTQAPSSSAPTAGNPDAQVGDNSKKPGGYYLDDGPDANPPKNIDSIPDATPKKEPLLARSNKPYKALGALYTPMSTSQTYKERGLASWYGKRFHGKKTASGEIYDMYGMSAAHTTLPLPSYARVTNPANGRSVIVRVNDRGPFKSTRIIDLSFAAAYKLRLVKQGSGMVEVEAIHPDRSADDSVSYPTASPAPAPLPEAIAIDAANTTPLPAPEQPVQVASEAKPVTIASPPPAEPSAATSGYFVQAGVFKNEDNAEILKKKIQALQLAPNARIYRVYNDGLHRLLLGPYDSKQAAELAATDIRRQLNTAAIVTNQ